MAVDRSTPPADFAGVVRLAAAAARRSGGEGAAGLNLHESTVRAALRERVEQLVFAPLKAEAAALAAAERAVALPARDLLVAAAEREIRAGNGRRIARLG